MATTDTALNATTENKFIKKAPAQKKFKPPHKWHILFCRKRTNRPKGKTKRATSPTLYEVHGLLKTFEVIKGESSKSIHTFDRNCQ